MFDPRTLQALVAIRHAGSVIAAADQLGYTPSAVSQQIKRLERDLASPLLERVGRGVVLTPAAHVLADEAQDLLERIETVEARTREAAERAHGTLRVAAFSSAIRGLLPCAITTLADKAPQVSLEVREIDPWDGVDAVGAGSVELAIVHNWEPLPLALAPNVRTIDLGVDEADVIMPADHPLADYSVLDAGQLLDFPWITVRPGSICHQWLTSMLRNAGGEPRVVHEVAEYDAQLALIVPTAALALIPRLGRASLPPGVVARTVRQRSRRRIMAAFRESHEATPALRACIEALETAAVGTLQPVDARPGSSA